MAPSTPLVDQTDLTIYKGLLYQYTQKNKLPLPTYNITMTGEPHKPSFTATVIINGTCYNGEHCSTKKIAEGKAARVAVIAIMGNGDAKEENVVENVGSYKTALQEYTHKHRWLDPQYEVTMEGDPHVPSFVATVVVNGVRFRGEPSSKKKEAEGKVAKIALLTLFSNSDELLAEARKETVSNDDARLPSSEIMEQKLVMEAPINTLSHEDALLPTSKVMEQDNVRSEHMKRPHGKKKLGKRTSRVKTGLTYTILGKYLIIKRKKKSSKRKVLSPH